jgi:signal transduction histidine kinase
MVGTKQHAVLPAGDIEQLDEYIKVNDESVIVTDLLGEEHRAIRRLLSSHKVELLMPLVREKTIIGYLALGSQQGTGYVKRDVKTLNMIASELIIAIQNARSVQEVRDINASLEQRIGLATAELRMSNARLRRVDAAKDEFLSMASHQLRTPLTSIKGYLSMVLEGDVGRVTKAQRQVLEEAFTSSERMVHLIHDFLNVSRLQTGKFVLEKDMYDVTKMIREEVSLLQRVAASRDMAIDYSVDIEQLVMKVDETKLRQVVVNFIDNAMYYSPAGSTVTVKLTKTSDRLEFRVDDKGIGVPLKEQAQLFQRFYRATNARKQRPDGTGVGLYLAKKIITAHGGDVRFSSKPGKGSTFGFWLPLEDESDELDDKPSDDKSNNKSD